MHIPPWVTSALSEQLLLEAIAAAMVTVFSERRNRSGPHRTLPKKVLIPGKLSHQSILWKLVKTETHVRDAVLIDHHDTTTRSIRGTHGLEHNIGSQVLLNSERVLKQYE